MRILFVHQNMPGQFGPLIAHLADSGHDVRAIGQQNGRRDFVPTLRYKPPEEPDGPTRAHRVTAQMLTRAHLAAAGARGFAREGFVPEVIVGHFAWGETLLLKDACPGAKLLTYADFFYHPGTIADTFDPEFPAGTPGRTERQRAMNALLLGSLSVADGIWSSTGWQAAQIPQEYRARTTVMHKGILTDEIDADPSAVIQLGPDGPRFAAGEEIVTYVARNLEPMRGFHVFMRALPQVLAARPNARVLIVGGEDVSYGQPPKGGGSWRDAMLAELGDGIDLSRVHFLGRVPREHFVKVLQVSAVHVYLTYPFVLSWSALEAMAARCLLVASDTPPLREVITSGRNGMLVDFFDRDALAASIVDGLANRESYRAMREAARRTVVEKYDLRRVCLPKQVRTIERLAARRPRS